MGALAAFILFIFVLAGVFTAPFSSYLLPITYIALVGMLVESLPLKDVDNTPCREIRGALVFWLTSGVSHRDRFQKLGFESYIYF